VDQTPTRCHPERSASKIFPKTKLTGAKSKDPKNDCIVNCCIKAFSQKKKRRRPAQRSERFLGDRRSNHLSAPVVGSECFRGIVVISLAIAHCPDLKTSTIRCTNLSSPTAEFSASRSASIGENARTSSNVTRCQIGRMTLFPSTSLMANPFNS
jgi:hypothetical protein